MYELSKQIEFESAHQLEGHPKCGKLHGHSYQVRISVTGSDLTEKYNFLIDFGKFKEIANKYDHSGEIIKVSCEVLAEDIANQIFGFMKEEHNITEEPNARISVQVFEGRHNAARYTLNKLHN